MRGRSAAPPTLAHASTDSGGIMSDHVYKLIELTGSSQKSSDDAIRNAIAKAARTLHGLNWFEVIETRGHIEGDQVMHWQVTLKVGVRLDD
jgi:flavin-binding protein dodecin